MSCFLYDPINEFNKHVDAPVEKVIIEEQAAHEAVRREVRDDGDIDRKMDEANSV